MDASGIPGAPSSKNRYVAALPALCSLAERREALARTPLLGAADRSLTPAERRYRVLALFDYFMPNARNLRISEGIDMMIRKGYEDRDPGKGRFQRKLRDLGVSDEAIVMLIDHARGEGLDPARDVLGFYSRVLELMRSRKRAKTAKPTDMGELPGDDLRRLLPEAADRGLNPIEALREANLGGIWPIVSPRRAD